MQRLLIAAAIVVVVVAVALVVRHGGGLTPRPRRGTVPTQVDRATSPGPRRRGWWPCSRRRRATRAPTSPPRRPCWPATTSPSTCSSSRGPRRPRALPHRRRADARRRRRRRRRAGQRPRPRHRDGPLGARRRRPLRRRRTVSSGGGYPLRELTLPARTDFFDAAEHVGGALRRMPPEVEQLPSARRDGQVAIFVERLVHRSEVEPSAVRLEAELDRRERQGRPERATHPVGSRIGCCRISGGRRGESRHNREELLEPGLGHPTFVGHGVEEAQQCARAGLSGPVQALCCRASSSGRCVVGGRSVSAWLTRRLSRTARAEIGERPGDRGAWQAADHGDVSTGQAGSRGGPRRRHANPKRSGRRSPRRRPYRRDRNRRERCRSSPPRDVTRRPARHRRVRAPSSRCCHVGADPVITRTPGQHLLEPARTLGRRDAGDGRNGARRPVGG